MKYLSVCDGIGAAHVAWKPLGWKCVGASEIAPFPKAVVEHRHPEIPALGSMTEYHDWNIERPDLVCGGTPCQSFSVAGLRKGMADPRGNLALVFLGVVDHFRPRWVVWENVPGVLSSNEGRDFGSFLGGLGQIGYGFAYRVLDAQYFGLAQRRKRVFVVGCLGDWRSAAAVLFERESLRRNTAPSRGKGKGVAPTISARPTAGGGLGTDFDLDGGLIAHTLKGEGFDASEDGTGRGVPLVPTWWDGDDVAATLTANNAGGEQRMPDKDNFGAILQPMLVRMREGKEGGGKGPLVSIDQSLTLATANDQVLAYSPKVDTLPTKGINHASTYEADASSILSTLLEKVGAEAYAQWGLGILGAFQSPEVLRAWLHGESLRQATDETRPAIIGGTPSSEKSAAGEVLRKVWFDGPDGRTSQGRGLAKQLAGKPGEALSALPHEGAPDETDMQVVRQAREGSRLLRQALSEIEAARRSEQVGVADQAEMHDAGMRPDEPRARAMQQARATTEEGNTGTATANQVTSGDGSLGPQMMVRRLLPEECEALQGFPRGYTNVPWRGKPESPDGNRYKALGNSWAVPVVNWIGKRIEAVNEITKK